MMQDQLIKGGIALSHVKSNIWWFDGCSPELTPAYIIHSTHRTHSIQLDVNSIIRSAASKNRPPAREEREAMLMAKPDGCALSPVDDTLTVSSLLYAGPFASRLKHLEFKRIF